MALLALAGEALALSFRRSQWVVERRGQPVREIRAGEVDEIQISGAAEVRASARVAALARGIPVVFLTADGRYRGRLEGPRSPTGALQVEQVRWLADPERALSLARWIVAGKVDSQWRLLTDVQRNRQDPAIGEAACQLRALSRRIPGAESLDQARGLEGQAAAIYYGVFDRLITHPHFRWSGRNRRPPRDPVNACLSFGYTLLATRVESALYATGLLPGVGSLHAPIRGQPALALDLMEEFRAGVVDRMTLRLVNRRQLSPEDFGDPSWRRPHLAVPGPAPREPDGPDLDEPPDDPADSEVEAAGGEPAGQGDPHTAEQDPRPVPVNLTAPGAPSPPRAVYLQDGGRRLFLHEFQRELRRGVREVDSGESPRLGWVLERQARRLARLFQGADPVYRPSRLG
ncbi:CRISPR-associated endonuclease Cas1 [Myxococcota bacterium]|nr:CRISPR-associated endonuclease Cas1 [Myxococcota bacterium]